MKKIDCTQFEGANVPPCSKFLNNSNPLIKDGKLIYRNENRLFYFISTTPKEQTSETRNQSVLHLHSAFANLQIGLGTYIIGLFIEQIESKLIKYDKNCVIHNDNITNTFIHQALKKAPQFDFNFTPSISLVVSNGNAILPLYTYTINITDLNFFILFIINRLEGNPAFFYGNNSFAEEDMINFAIANMSLQFPKC